MKHFFTITFTVLLCFGAYAQYPGAQGGPPKIGVLKGKVVDNTTNEAIGYATITIKSVKDSTVLTGGISNENGEFEITEIQLGNNFAEISYLGYDKVIKGPYVFSPQESVKHDAGTVSLGISSSQLEAVVVEGTAPAVRYEVDKKVYDAQQIRAAEGGNAKDVLEQIPSITVDDQSNILLRGSQNVRVLVNGRPSSFSLQTLLEQIPQKNIKDVEVITNPSAKYDAEGEAGIINIVLKQNNIEGFNGNFSANYGTEDKYNGNIGLNLKTSKWNLTSSFNLNRFEDDFLRDNLRNSFANPGTDQIADEDREFVRNGDFAKIGIDHYLNPSSTVFFSASLNDGDGYNNSITRNTDVFFGPAGGLRDYDRLNDGFDDRFGYEFTLGLQKEFDNNPSHNLLFDIAYNTGDDGNINNRSNVFINPADAIFNSVDRDLSDNENTTTTMSLDYTNPYDGKQKLELGFKTILEDKDQQFRIFNEGMLSSDQLFNFDQDVVASYMTYEKNFDKLGIKGGLRSEFTEVDSKVNSDAGEYADTYISLFPSAAASYKLSESANIRLGYSRRINRPNGRQLTPFTDRTDLNNGFQGNNLLRPEFTDSYEMSYSKFWEKFSIDASLFHRGVNDQIRYSREVDPDGASTITFKNLGKLNAYGIESSFNLSPANWINISLSGNYNYGKVTDEGDSAGEIQEASTSLFSGRLMTNLNLPKGWGGQISTNYQSPFFYYQGKLAAMYGINLSARKSFMKGKFNTFVRANDIFNTNGLMLDFEDDFQTQTLELDWPSQMGFIGFNYNFGQMKKPAKRKQQRREERGPDQPSTGFGG